jgi:hypothetical protein
MRTNVCVNHRTLHLELECRLNTRRKREPRGAALALVMCLRLAPCLRRDVFRRHDERKRGDDDKKRLDDDKQCGYDDKNRGMMTRSKGRHRWICNWPANVH